MSSGGEGGGGGGGRSLKGGVLSRKLQYFCLRKFVSENRIRVPFPYQVSFYILSKTYWRLYKLFVKAVSNAFFKLAGGQTPPKGVFELYFELLDPP